MKDISKGDIYGNISFLHPDGTLMFYGNSKKAKWYFERNLARQVGENVFQLTFEPAGRGQANNVYLLEEKKNCCVVCGSLSNLNRHHIVPKCYRRFMPEEYKNHNSYDVVILCVKDHMQYENKASQVKKSLIVDFGLEKEEKEEQRKGKEKFIIGRYLSQTNETHPNSRIKTEDQIRKLLGLKQEENINLKILYEILETKSDSVNKKVVEKFDNYLDLVVFWRKHFVEVMNPKFLSSNWTTDNLK